MEKNNFIYPGTVFTAKNYDPFTKKMLAHPFVCIYDQALDPNLQGETNILALLITSNSKQSTRQVPILKVKNPFLEKDSFCYCNNIYMFLKTDINVIGHLDSDTFFDVVQKRQMLLRGENDQCVQALMNMKAYEYKQKVKAKEEKQQREMNNHSYQDEESQNGSSFNKNPQPTYYHEKEHVSENLDPSTQSLPTQGGGFTPSPKPTEPKKRFFFHRHTEKRPIPNGDKGQNQK
ncbi:MAG: hypothetical protein LKJ88_04305 [Bacilli bacterium]|jgi:hypothetical protein|nr:hypothetical protein [Bacilli bacterium]